MGQPRSPAAARPQQTAKFALGENALVIDDDGHRVEPGSGEVGRVAVGGLARSGTTRTRRSRRPPSSRSTASAYSIPGDYATVEADGTLTLLGRGSVCINTGGEKVFPEEVEEALKEHPVGRDAVAVGVPDERFGEAVTAVVEPVRRRDGGRGAR